MPCESSTKATKWRSSQAQTVLSKGPRLKQGANELSLHLRIPFPFVFRNSVNRDSFFTLSELLLTYLILSRGEGKNPCPPCHPTGSRSRFVSEDERLRLHLLEKGFRVGPGPRCHGKRRPKRANALLMGSSKSSPPFSSSPALSASC